MTSLKMGKDFLMVTLLRQWAEENGFEDSLCEFLSDCIQQQKNPFDRKLDAAMQLASRALAAHMPSRNGHGPIQAINGVAAPAETRCTGKARARFATIEAPAEAKGQEKTLFDGPFLIGDKLPGTYRVDMNRLADCKTTVPNIIRVWLLPLAAHTSVTNEDFLKVLEESLHSFPKLSDKAKNAVVDNASSALRRDGILVWEQKGNHYKRGKFFKTERCVNPATGRMMKTDAKIQIFLDGGNPARRGKRIKQIGKRKK